MLKQQRVIGSEDLLNMTIGSQASEGIMGKTITSALNPFGPAVSDGYATGPGAS